MPTTFISGPWETEANEASFEEKASRYQCFVRRNKMGNLCGYVKVPESHPFHGLGYSTDAVDHAGIEIHGGITYSENAAPDGTKGWTFGFDTSHSMDFSPVVARYRPPSGNEVYRNMDYVKSECESLARQLFALATPEDA